MKPCRRYKKSVALLAASALTDLERVEVRDHLRRCAGCREYLESMADLCATYRRAAESLDRVDSDPEFCSSLVKSTLAASGGSGFVRERPSAWLNSRSWRVRWAFGALTLALLGIFWLWPLSLLQERHSEIHTERRVQPERNELHPDSKQIVYRLAVGRSFEEFDRLLSREMAAIKRVEEPSYQLLSAWRNPDL